ncbi:hypothetical protein M3J09_001097 [Ascochyta lentis]
MFDTWFSYKLAPDGDLEDGCHPEEAQALKDYLRQKTTTAEAAQAITRPTVTAENPREDFARLWGFLMDALMELPRQYIEALIALLRAIEDLPTPELTATASNEPVVELWRGLPGFGHLWSDMCRTGNWRNMVGVFSSPEHDALQDEYIRHAEIEARLVAADLAGIPLDWGYEAVADALESRTATLGFDIPAAAEWLVHCGERFRQGARNKEKSWGLVPHSRECVASIPLDLWKEPVDQEMSLERWMFWRARLEELHMKSMAVKDAVERALNAMYMEELVEMDGNDNNI